MDPVTIGIDGYLQDTSTDDYWHGWLSSWMAIFTVPVTISTANYQHGGLPAWILLYIVIFLQDTSMDGYLHGSCNHRYR